HQVRQNTTATHVWCKAGWCLYRHIPRPKRPKPAPRVGCARDDRPGRRDHFQESLAYTRKSCTQPRPGKNDGNANAWKGGPTRQTPPASVCLGDLAHDGKSQTRAACRRVRCMIKRLKHARLLRAANTLAV